MTAKSSRHVLAETIDTGQITLEAFDTGQAYDAVRLVVTKLDVHRIDCAESDNVENVMSTLRWFGLKVSVLEDCGAVTAREDGLKLQATLVLADTGHVVEDKSATQEPPLLGTNSVVENGEAVFKLRITVLSSLCRGNKFRVLISAVDQPDLCVTTSPLKTITKLRRGPRAGAMADGTLKCGKRGREPLEWDLGELEEEAETPDAGKRTTEELWAEIHINQELIVELQQQQRDLFLQLEDLRIKTDKGDLDAVRSGLNVTGRLGLADALVVWA